MHGMSALPATQVATLHDRVKGDTMGDLHLTPPVDESISALARRTVVIGEKILLLHGARLDADSLIIPFEQPTTQQAELFTLADFTKLWNPDWTLERAGFGGAGGGIEGIRGGTHLEGQILSIFPRDEVRGALLRRSVKLSDTPSFAFDAGADAGRAWHLQVFVNNDKVFDRLIEGNPTMQENALEHHWEHIRLDLATYRKQSVVIRLYDLVLVPNHQAGNSYWRGLQLQ
jgi:hypothetical protein